MKSGWYEKKVYIRSIGRSVAPKHRTAALNRLSRYEKRHRVRTESVVKQMRGKRFKQQHFDRVVKEEDAYYQDPYEYLSKVYSVPMNDARLITLYYGMGKHGRCFLKSQLDSIGTLYVTSKIDQWRRAGVMSSPEMFTGGSSEPYIPSTRSHDKEFGRKGKLGTERFPRASKVLSPIEKANYDKDWYQKLYPKAKRR
jgi:hypothetical protein